MEKTVVARLKLELNQYLAGLKKGQLATAEFAREISGHGTASRKHIEQVGKGALVMAGGVALGLGLAAKAAIDWESAWAGVSKTVDGTAPQMAALESGLRGLARELPATHKEIAGVAEAAGQLGVARDDIVDFTRVMVDLGETTNLTADEAATSIAQMMNIMGTASSDVDNLGAALVDLGNNGASTESEILDMSLRLAGAGKLIGATDAEVLALSNTMASLGIQSELGGGAMSRTLLKIYSAVEDGGEKLEGFARISGLSAQEFSSKWESDPLRAVDAFVQGLSRIEASGGNVVEALREVGIKGVQDLQVLLRLKGAGDLFAESLDLGTQAWADNTALAIEAGKRYATTESQLKVLRNEVVDLGIDMGDRLLPAVKGTADMFSNLVTGITSLPGPAKTAVAGLAGITGAGLGIVGMVGTIGPKVGEMKKALDNMGRGGQFVSRNLGTIAQLAGAAAVGLTIITYAIGEAAAEAAAAERRVKGFTDAIYELGETGAGTEQRISDMVSTNADFARLLSDTGIKIEEVASALQGSDAAYEAFIAHLNQAGEAGGVSADTLGRAGIAFGIMRSEARQGAVDAAAMNDVLGESAEAAADAETGALHLAGALEDEAAAAQAVTDAVDEMIEAQAAALDPLFGMLSAVDGNREAQIKLQEVLANSESSLAEIDAAHQAVAESALDVEAAALRLEAGIQAGTVSLDLSKGMLDEWVAQGLISEETAIRMGAKFEEAATKANTIGGDQIVNIIANTDEALAKIAEVARRMRAFGITGPIGAYYVAPGAQGPVLPLPQGPIVPGSERGGPVRATGMPRPGPTDTIPILVAPGEYIINAGAAARLGPQALDTLNRGQLPTQAGTRFTGGTDLASTGTMMGQQPGPIEVDLRVLLDTAGADRHLKDFLRHTIAVQHGGNVQKALGR